MPRGHDNRRKEQRDASHWAHVTASGSERSVTLNTNPGGIIFHEPRDTKHESLLRSSAIKSVKVKLTDERDRALALATASTLDVSLARSIFSWASAKPTGSQEPPCS